MLVTFCQILGVLPRWRAWVVGRLAKECLDKVLYMPAGGRAARRRTSRRRGYIWVVYVFVTWGFAEKPDLSTADVDKWRKILRLIHAQP